MDSSHLVTIMEKPIQHIGLADWHSRVNQLRNVANARRNDAFDIRHLSRTLRNETRIEADWSNYESNEALSSRIAELNRWRITIQKAYDRIVQEVNLLKEECASTERELEAMTTPLTVVAECLTMRDSRLGSELTNDDADTELKKELSVVENNHRLLREQCHAAWEKLIRLEEVQQKIANALDHKIDAEKIDATQLELNKLSSNITFKTDPTRHPRNSCTYQAWLESTKNLKQMAENELTDTYSVRESLFVAREKARNILISQQDRTEHTIRKRIFETQRARNELEWQKLKMKEEMQKVHGEIRNLEQALRDKTDALKLAETRLENRTERLGIEKCLDEPYDKLCLEVSAIRTIRRNLEDQIDAARTSYNILEEHEHKIDEDLNNKQHSLMTDIKALDLRARLRGGEFVETMSGPSAQTERNIKLTRMEDEVPKN
ncbi:tektin-2 [Episyrphus balteatus]|uniref:tektin-2 n=1 Tax=Episyrphus balteatus TaxID=286459 RepID=UPI0024853C74|nr:tektin-2 [Episyrphus balteatus]